MTTCVSNKSESASNMFHTTGILPSDLQNELDLIREIKAFDPELFVKNRTMHLLKYMSKYNIHCVVLSVSGGIDSAVVLGLLKKAQSYANLIPTHPFNENNGGKIIAIAQPIKSTSHIQNRAYELEDTFGIKIRTICQDDVYDLLIKQISDGLGKSLSNFSSSMLKSYMRTPVAYAVASNYGGIVVGTGNFDEDGYLYYYCKFGDGAVDVGLIWDLHKSEVFTLGEWLDIPQSILDAPPSADLFEHQTDESEIGFGYDWVELIVEWILNFTPDKQNNFMQRISLESQILFNFAKDKITQIHLKGAHKADLNPKNMGSCEFECDCNLVKQIEMVYN